jgi:hypothetical protein
MGAAEDAVEVLDRGQARAEGLDGSRAGAIVDCSCEGAVGRVVDEDDKPELATALVVDEGCFVAEATLDEAGGTVSVRFAQSMAGLIDRSHGLPRMMSCLPIEVTWNSWVKASGAVVMRRDEECVMSPPRMGRPSATRVGMGTGRGEVAIPCFLTKLALMRERSAAQSTKALTLADHLPEEMVTGRR